MTKKGAHDEAILSCKCNIDAAYAALSPALIGSPEAKPAVAGVAIITRTIG